MNKSEFKKLKFSDRHFLSRGAECEATWQVESVSGAAYYISCRTCGTEIQAGCTPRCLNKVTDLSRVYNPKSDEKKNPL